MLSRPRQCVSASACGTDLRPARRARERAPAAAASAGPPARRSRPCSPTPTGS